MIGVADQNHDRRIKPVFPVLRTEQVPCAVCGDSSCRRLYSECYRAGSRNYRLGINRCLSCGQVYVSPRLDQASTAEVYRLHGENTISHNYCWAGRTSDDRFTPLLDRITEREPCGRLLDVGCGTGRFLSAAQQRGRWELTGVEPVEAAAREAQTQVRGTIHCATLDQAALPDGHFDIISMLGVLEHLHDPVAVLRTAGQLLKPNGCLAVYVPNFYYLRLKDAGPACWLIRRRRSRLAPQEHLFHFTPHLLKQLFDQTGFQLQRIDVGRPFVSGRGYLRRLKQAAHLATVALHRVTGVHLGGIEAIASREHCG